MFLVAAVLEKISAEDTPRGSVGMGLLASFSIPRLEAPRPSILSWNAYFSPL